MKCAQCGFDNSSSSKFCSNCGEKLEANCKACGAVVQANSKFCAECGARILEEVTIKTPTCIELSNDSAFHNIEVQITSVLAKGPDSDQDYSIDISFAVVNNGSESISFLSVTTQVLNSVGLVVADTLDSYEEEIAPSNSGEFQTSIWSVKKDLLGVRPEAAKVIVSVIAAAGEKTEIFRDKMFLGEFDVVPVLFSNSLGKVELLAGSYWQTRPDDDNDTYIESRVLLQNMTSDFFPQAKLYTEVLDRNGELLDSSDNYQELVAKGVVCLSTSSRFQVKDLQGSSISLYIQMLKMCGMGVGMAENAKLVVVENGESDDDVESSEGSKRIYVKTEPGGRIIFGRLSREQEEQLKVALVSKVLPEDLIDLRFNSSGDLREYEGVFNQGAEGDFGNEGTIVLDEDGPIEIPRDSSGKYKDGCYFVYMSLSKVSIEFEFSPSDGEFDPAKFEEVSVPVILPDSINHELYGHPDYNVVIDYRYDGHSIDEYSRELVDRGYDDQINFVIVKNGVPTIVYKNYNGEESWPDNRALSSIDAEDKAGYANLLERFAAEFEEIGNKKGVFVKGNIPEKKLINAIQAYANGVSQENVLLLLDDTVFGSAKEGLLMTTDAIYGHQLGLKPVKVNYSNIKSSDSENERLGCYLRLNELRFVMIAAVDKQVVAKLASLIEKCASCVNN